MKEEERKESEFLHLEETRCLSSWGRFFTSLHFTLMNMEPLFLQLWFIRDDICYRKRVTCSALFHYDTLDTTHTEQLCDCVYVWERGAKNFDCQVCICLYVSLAFPLCMCVWQCSSVFKCVQVLKVVTKIAFNEYSYVHFWKEQPASKFLHSHSIVNANAERGEQGKVVELDIGVEWGELSWATNWGGPRV